MKINNLLLPHPVLGRGDDAAGEFKILEDGFAVYQDEQKTRLSVNFILKNETLEKLISKGEASFNVEIECPATFYRKSFLFIKDQCEIEIEKNNLRGKVYASFYVTSNIKIPDYKIIGANSDYANASFEINEADVIGYAGSTSFNAEILWEDLRRLFNIMKIEKDTEREEGPAMFNLNSDIIYITLSKTDYIKYENYKEENDSYTPIYHASIVLPALIFALNEMMSEERFQDYRERKWFQVLDSRRLNDDEIRSLWQPENIPDIAQKMIGGPISKMLLSIETISMKQGED